MTAHARPDPRLRPRRAEGSDARGVWVEAGARPIPAAVGVEAAEPLDAAVDAIYRRHRPLGWPPFVLAAATGMTLAAFVVQSKPWYVADACSLAASAVAWFAATLFWLTRWSRVHPLLAELHRLRYGGARDGAGVEPAGLSEAIVRHYLPPAEHERLVGRV
jgi:hypothetical protein